MIHKIHKVKNNEIKINIMKIKKRINGIKIKIEMIYADTYLQF